MSLITLNDSLIDVMMKMSAGNPGAASVLMQIYKESPKIDPQDFMQGLGPILALDTHRIYGPDIWVLYKDICSNSVINLIAVLRSVQLGMIPESKMKAAITDAREGYRASTAASFKDEVHGILLAVMERLEEFNRVPKEPAPDVPPSWFMEQGIPSCSVWGKAEIEYLAWAYIAGMALDVGPDIDTWHPVTAERCLEVIQHDERAMLYAGGELRSVIEGREHAVGWWKDITELLVDSAGGFKVGGLAWNKHRYAKSVAEQEAAVEAATEAAVG